MDLILLLQRFAYIKLTSKCTWDHESDQSNCGHHRPRALGARIWELLTNFLGRNTASMYVQPLFLAHLWLELDLLLLVEVCIVGELVDVAVVLLPVLEEEKDGADQQRQRHRHQDRLLGANLKQGPE